MRVGIVATLLLAACAGEVEPSNLTIVDPTSTTFAATTTLETPTTTSGVFVVEPCGVTVPGEGTAPGETRTDGCGVAQVWVPAESFVQGTADTTGLEPPAWAEPELASEQPAHEVTITQGFWIDAHEVTNAEFKVFIDAGGYDAAQFWSEKGWAFRSEWDFAGPVDCGGGPEYPRVCVTWHEAEAYANWRGARLPTESEWEYAARGPDSLIYPWGDEWDPTKANVTELQHTAPVGSYPDGSSWVGAFDMAGNAMEWVNDWLDTDYYTAEPQVDPTGPEQGFKKVEKGGWWGSDPFVARSAYRHFEDPPTYQDHHIGFRLVSG